MRISGAVESLRQEGLARMREGRFDLADQLFEQAAAVAPDDSERVLMEIHRASAAIFEKRSSPFIDHLPAVLMRRDSPLHVLLAAYYLIMHLCISQQSHRALPYLRTMIDAAEQYGDPFYLATAYESASAVATAVRNFGLSREHSLRALELLSASDAKPSQELLLLRAAMMNNVAYALLGLGKYEEAIPYLRDALAILEAEGGQAYSAEAHLNLALAYYVTGRVDEADQCLNDADARLSARNARMRRYVHYLRGEIEQKRGNHEVAREHFERLREYYPDFAELPSLLGVIDLAPLLLPEPEWRPARGRCQPRPRRE